MIRIIECPYCRQKNRINDQYITQAKCAKCWKIIYLNPQNLRTKNKFITYPINSSYVLGLITIICLIIFISFRDNTTNFNIKSKFQLTHQEQLLPNNGEISLFTNNENVAPLQINTPYGSNYVVKLKDASTKIPIMTIFIHGGSSLNIKVPLGIYEITYASGEKWYGYDYLFGSGTVYSKADKVFSFKRTGSQIDGYTLTLHQVVNGNLKTTNINKSNF